jgi:hypothetical protein
MESITLTKEQEYGVELVIKNFIKKNPGIVDVKVHNVTEYLIFCDLYLTKELIEKEGGLKIADRASELGNRYVYLEVVYYTYGESEKKKNAQENLSKFDKSLKKEIDLLYRNLPKNLKKYNFFGNELEFSFSSFFIA